MYRREWHPIDWPTGHGASSVASNELPRVESVVGWQEVVRHR